MPLETGVEGPWDLNDAWPAGSEFKNEGDDHIRNIKTAMKGMFPDMLFPNIIGNVLGVNPANNDVHAPQWGQVKTYADDLVSAVFHGANLPRVSWGYLQDDDILGGSGDFTVVKISGGQSRLTFDSDATSTNGNILVACPQATNPGAVLSVNVLSVRAFDVFAENAGGGSTFPNFFFLRICNAV